MKHHNKTIERLKLNNRVMGVLLYSVAIYAIGTLFIWPKTISPCPNDCVNAGIKVVYASEEIPEFEQIVAYITKKFAPEGKHVVVQAINCFYSESGLRNNAVGVNKNGSNDVGVAQINSIHGMSTEERMDYKKNIDKAYKIYKSRGNWSAWYGKGCK